MTKSSCSLWCCLTLTLFLFQGLWFPILCSPYTTEFEYESRDALPEWWRKRSSPRCPDGWNEFGTKCYRVFGKKFSERKSWTAANAKCIETGSTLVSIHSSKEQGFVASYVSSIGSDMWIGLHLPTPSGKTFRWTDKSRNDFEDWAPNEPNFSKGQEQCVLLRAGRSPIGKWNDMTCSSVFPFICQKPKVICGEDIESGEGSIASPNYPEKYSANAKCNSRITVPSGYLVHLTFQAFELEKQSECRFDYVKIFEGRNLSRPPLKILCGSDIPSDIFSTGNELSIEFKSDSLIQYDGFFIQFRKDYQCGGDIVAEEGVISSLNYPNAYLPDARCSWNITVPANYRVSFKFLIFKLEKESSCNYDYVKITDGHESDSPILGKFCGYRIPDVPVSSGNRMRIDFQSDNSSQHEGFTAEFKKGDCGADIVSHEGAIATPGYPAHYGPSMSCVWRITVPTGYRVVLTFVHMKVENHVPCDYDYVMVLDGHESSSRILGTFCGNYIPNAIRSSGNELSIKFNSDISEQFEGFSAEFKKEFICKDDTCKNGGYCSPDGVNRGFKCTCEHGYRGITCDEISRDSTVNYIPAIIGLAVLAAVLLIAFTILTVFLLKRSRERRLNFEEFMLRCFQEGSVRAVPSAPQAETSIRR